MKTTSTHRKGTMGETTYSILRTIVGRNSGEWYPGCGWHWQGAATTTRYFEILERQGYVERQINPSGDWSRFRVTVAGRERAAMPRSI